MYRKFYLTCVEDNSSDEEDEEDEEVIAEDGEVGEHQEKPEDLLDNYYFLPGEDDFEVCLSVAISIQYVPTSTYLLTFYLSIGVSTVSINLSALIYLSVCLSVYLSIYLSSVCLWTSTSICLCI